MDPNYFKPIALYLDQNDAVALMYLGKVDETQIQLAIDRDRVALSVESPGYSVVMGYQIANQQLFVNRRPAMPDRFSTFQEWVDRIQAWGQAGQVEIQLVKNSTQPAARLDA